MLTPSFNLTATERVLPRMALDFTTALLDSRVTIARALDTATAVNSSGFVAGVNANLPRFDYDPTTLACKGLLIEESRSNVCIQSGDIDNVAWSRAGVGVVGDTVTSPAGTTTGNTVTCSAGSSVHRVVSTAGTVTSGASATHSVFVKAGTHSFFQIHDGSTGTFYANFNLTTGTVTAVNPVGGATITPYGNGWYKCTLTLTAGATTSIGAIAIIPDGTSLRNPTWTAAGTESIYAWGYQIEVGAFATSYIPTTTTSLTRNADVVSMTGTNFSSWYSNGAGAFQIATTPRTVTGVRPIVQADDTSANNIISLRQNSADPELYIVSGGAAQAQIDAGTVVANTAYKLCGSWNTDNCAVAKDGAVPATDISAAIPTPTQLRIGSDGTNYANMWVAKLNYWPQRIANAETQAFSK